MSKSIIGFYHPPLSQVDRDEILVILTPSMKEEILFRIKDEIENQAALFFEPFIGDVTFNLLSTTEALNNRMRNWMTQFLYHYRDIKQIQDWDIYNVKFIDGKDITFVFSDGFIELFKDPNKLHMPERNKLSNDDYRLVEKVNHHLSLHPEDRIFDKTDQALLIDSFNKAIISQLQTCCYESQNSSTIYDFSQFGLDLIKGLNK